MLKQEIDHQAEKTEIIIDDQPSAEDLSKSGPSRKTTLSTVKLDEPFDEESYTCLFGCQISVGIRWVLVSRCLERSFENSIFFRNLNFFRFFPKIPSLISTPL